LHKKNGFPCIVIIDSIKGYSFEGKVFESVSLVNESLIMERIQSGRINLYQLDGKYLFIKKGSKEPERLKNQSFKEKLKEYIFDCPNCIEALQNEKKAYSDIVNIIADYNNQTEYIEDIAFVDSTLLNYKQEKVIFKLNIFSPGVAAEIKTIENLTLYFEVGSSFYITSKSNIVFIPIAKFQSRYYHNLNKRKEKGMYVRGYSGNYFGIDIRQYFSTSKTTDNFYIAPVYGIQRCYSHRFFYNIDVGVGYSASANAVSPLFSTKWGIWF
jgi:hypothetical protein